MANSWTGTRARVCRECGGSGPFGYHPNSPDKQRARCNLCIAKQRRELIQRDEGVRRKHLEGNVRRHGIEYSQYGQLLAEQDGVCALCDDVPIRRRLCIDHDHAHCPTDSKNFENRSCGKCIRGLLCDSCNQLVGKIDRIGVAKIVAYLQAPYREV